MKDNYYDATHEHIFEKTGERIFKTPVYMQREPEPIDKEFIQVGVECYFRHPTRAEAKEGKGFIETAPSRPILMKRTKELEEAEEQMLKDFARAILPIIKNDIAISKQPNYEAYIAEQESRKEKELKRLNRETERETHRITEKYDRNISIAKRHLEEKTQ